MSLVVGGLGSSAVVTLGLGDSTSAQVSVSAQDLQAAADVLFAVGRRPRSNQRDRAVAVRARIKTLRDLDENVAAFGTDWSLNDRGVIEAQAFIDSQERGQNSICVRVKTESASVPETFAVDVAGIFVGKRVLSESGLSELVLVERLEISSSSK